jgi:GNAT superfamily N-acetyltransferase
MMEIAIREMRASDIEEASRVVCDSFRWGAEREGFTSDQINGYFAERGSPEALRAQFPLCRWLVACKGDRIIGVVAVKGNEIDKLYVDPRFFRQGIGRRLFQGAEELIVRSGHKEITLGTGFPSTLPFYRAMGMHESGRKTIAVGPCVRRTSTLLVKPASRRRATHD